MLEVVERRWVEGEGEDVWKEEEGGILSRTCMAYL